MKRLQRLLIALGFLAFGPVAADAQNAFVFPSGGSASLGGPTTTLGAADAASPVAQTLGVQSVVAGTTNTAGGIFNINGPIGTGNANPGLNIALQSPVVGSSGTTQETLHPFVSAGYIGAAPSVQIGDATTNVAVVPGADGNGALGASGRRWSGGFIFGNLTMSGTAIVTAAQINPSVVYSAAGTAVPTCNAGANGNRIIASDITTVTYRAAYVSGGANTGQLLCVNGTGWIAN